MEQNSRVVSRAGAGALAVLVVCLATGVGAQSPAPKRFIGGRIVLEDQGSFFIGGVPKITDHAAVPFAPPGQPAPPPAAQQITIGQMYVQFQIPARQSGPRWPVIMVVGSPGTELEFAL